ncbi:MAG TPA: insulinase family protein [Candidatus Saccharimonadales bacterium]|jgi:zinc protease|nr:insulinase family protein [Candidatus Saccharimonadales bacterium]
MNRRFRYSYSKVMMAAFLAAATLASAQKAAPAKAAPAAKQKNDLATADLAAIKRPPLPPFHPQIPKRIQLANGMIIFLQEDHELPLIDASASLRGGSKTEAADKVGMISILGTSWRTGGTKTRTGDQLDDLLEARAARVESGSDQESVTVSLSCLKGDFDFVFEVFNDILKNPEFRQEKIDLAKDGIRTGIARRNDNLGQIAGREATRIGYGPQSPYARVAEYATVKAVTRQDLLDWHASHAHPNNILFGITGDFDSADMEAKLRKAFDGWAKGPDVKVAQIDVPAPQTGVYFVEKSDVNQSEIRMVAPGIRRDNPDYYAVEVLNQIFGGSFGSRLFSSLRTREGLAYSVGGGTGALLGHPGLTRISMGTKSGSTARAIEGLYREIEAMKTRPATTDELQKAKDSILNSFIFEYDSKDKVMQARLSYEFHGYPPDFLEQYRKGIEAVTAADVDRVAHKYLDKSKFALLVVGKAADFDKPLSTFGPVTNVDITIPTGEAGAAGVARASNPEGKAILARVVEGAGGAEKVKGIKSMRRKSTISVQGNVIESELTDVVPDKIHAHFKLPMGEASMVIASQEGFLEFGGNVNPLPERQRDDLLGEMSREFWLVAQHEDDPQYIFSAQGSEKVGDVQAAILDVTTGKSQVRWFVDPKSGHILRAQFQANTPTGPATQVLDYSEWKTADGITVPFHAEMTANGNPGGSITVNSYEFNPVLDSKLFDKPEKK